MLFRRLVSVKDFRFFKDWSADGGLRPHRFGAKTLVYGPNGSGKSTLADIFQAVQYSQKDGAIPDAWLSDVEFEIVNDAGTLKNVKATSSDVPSLLVFNEKYVKKNLEEVFDSGGEGNPLLVLGEKDVDLENKINAKEAEEETGKQKAGNCKTAANDAKDKLDDVLEAVKADVFDHLSGFDPSLYNKQKFKKPLATKLLAGDRAKLDDAALKEAKDTLAEKPDDISDDLTLELPRELDSLNTDLDAIATHKVTAQAIERLASDSRLQSWAQEGMKHHSPGEKCAFCDNEFTQERLGALKKHFDDSLTELQSMLEAARKTLQTVEDDPALEPESLSDLLSHGGSLQAAVEAEDTSLEAFRADTKEWCENARALLDAREADLVGSKELDWSARTVPERSVWQRLQDAVGVENVALKERRDKLSELQEEAVEKIKKHVAAVHYSDYQAADTAKTIADNALQTAKDDLKNIQDELTDLRGQRGDQLDGEPLAKRLSDDLATYLGHTQFSVEFRRREGRPGRFAFLRNGTAATNFSEGERNAIALLYFLRSFDTDDVKAKLPSSCVVIDDPVSSLDQDSIISAFSFLHSCLHKLGGELRCEQCIILTHNFEFLRLWKMPLERAFKKDKKKAKDDGVDVFSFPVLRACMLEFAVKASVSNGEVVRTPELRRLGLDLGSLDSEYYFLFEKACESTLPGQEGLVPLTGNATRRLLESFLRFKSPSLNNFAEAAKTIGDEKEVPREVTQRIVKALHGASHRSDLDIHSHAHATSVIDDIRATLLFIERVDSGHYAGMKKAVNKEPILLPRVIAST